MENEGHPPGRLVVVATPIGNLEDLSPRAARALAEADLVASEDTRHTGRLLAHLGLKRPLLSLHEHNERQRLPQLLDRLSGGATIALVSDAGTPLVSDPGYVLVRAAIAAGFRVEPIPGPSAVLAALVASGLPPCPFTFAGFPPPKSGRRRSFSRRLAELGHTVVLFESPHRLLASLADALAELGDRPAAIGRELTKLHEEILRGPLAALRDELAARPSLKGEFVLVIGGSADAQATSGEEIQQPPSSREPE
ncbi:MAG TPA: 16S rRNA (cytidine(1402)-2'-O)-methyltransferase [Thermoanaerobaculia bacterium]|nr:16S rRNA (cytidine(1402)-2'-O)-methyltransferase [Thermoanaerobaculia bacterium]